MAEMSYCEPNKFVTPEYEATAGQRWMRFALRLAANSVFHPIEYARVLMQLGYEPWREPPYLNLLDRPVISLPNVLYYAQYIIHTDGIRGAYVGLRPRVVGNIVGTILCTHIADILGYENVDDTDCEKKDVDIYYEYIANLGRDIVTTFLSVVAFQPFSVISVRMMTQFIGREAIYDTFWQSFKEIYSHEGARGFFAGLTPRLLADISNVLITSTAALLMNRFFLRSRNLRLYNAALIQFLVSFSLNPLNVVATCMTVKGSRLVAGAPPFMPSYRTWIECWRDLAKRNELNRGRNLLNWPTISPLLIGWFPSSTYHSQGIRTVTPALISTRKKSFRRADFQILLSASMFTFWLFFLYSTCKYSIYLISSF